MLKSGFDPALTAIGGCSKSTPKPRRAGLSVELRLRADDCSSMPCINKSNSNMLRAYWHLFKPKTSAAELGMPPTMILLVMYTNAQSGTRRSQTQAGPTREKVHWLCKSEQRSAYWGGEKARLNGTI